MKNSRSKKHKNEEKPEGTFAGHFLKIEKSLGFSLTSGSSVIIITKRKVQFQQSSKKKKKKIQRIHQKHPIILNLTSIF